MIVKTKHIPRVLGLFVLLSLCLNAFSQITIISDATWKGVGTNALANGTAWLFPGYNDAAWPLVQAPNPGNVIPVVPGSLSMWVLPYSDTAKMRKTFVVPVADSYNGSISINADNEFTLYFNGVSQGFFNWWPSGPFTFNISPALQGCTQNVIAVNAVNWSGPYGNSLSTTINVVNPLNTPVAVAATNVSCNSFTANWGAVPTADFYLLDVSTDPNFGSFYSIYQDFNTGAVTSFNLTSLPGPGPYYYRLRCQRTNVLGTLVSCYSNVITVNLAAAPFVDAGNDVYLCPGSSTTLLAIGAGTISWLPVAGIAPANVLNPTVNPAVSTTYTLTVTNGTCVVTDSMTVSVANLPPLILSNDTTICPGNPVNLTVSGGDYFAWSPYPGIVDSSLTTQTVTPAVNTTYTVTSYTVANNLIVNGDFSAGNTGFNSSYAYAFPNTLEGQYYVGTNPQAWNGGLSPCGDNTSGSGNMLMVNGSPIPNSSIWCQTVPVSPNTDYLFSTWVTPAYAINLPSLQFSINGVNLGNPFSPSGSNCTWEEFFATWNSGASFSANICIVNQNTNINGNDFAIDDISFSPVCTQTGTVDVTIGTLPAPVVNNTGPYCVGSTIQLNSVAGSATDDWTGPLGFVANNTQNPTIVNSTVAMSGIYTVTVTSAAGCSATGTTNVAVNALPLPVAGNTGPYCLGANINLSVGAGFIDWDWTGPAGYNQVNTQNPVIPLATLAMGGVYTVTVTNAAGCTSTSTTTVVVNNVGVIAPNNTGPFCVGTTISLNAPAGAITYDWVGPAAYSQLNLQNPTIPLSTIAMAGDYTVTATYAGGCTSTGTTTVVINPLPLPGALSNSPICAGFSIDLFGSGGLVYDWAGPNVYVQNNTQNPTILIATVAATGSYTVTVTDANACSATATVNVIVNALPPAMAGNTGPVCAGSNIGLTSSGGNQYAWVGPGGYSDPINQNPVIIGAVSAQSGVYTVTVTDANNCVSTASTSIVINALPVINANINTPVCEGQSFTLNGLGGSSYDWVGPNGFVANNNASPIINNSTVSNAGLYTVTGTDVNGCSSTATVNALVNPAPTAAFSTDLTTGCTPLCVNFVDNSSIVGSTIMGWSWNVESQNIITTSGASFCFNSAGLYDASLTVTSLEGCTSTLSLLNLINAVASPIADFTYAPQLITEMEPDVNFGNTSFAASNFVWDFGDGTSSLSANAQHTYQDTGVYCVSLLASNILGCADTVTHCLIVTPVFTLYIPNTFTPNEDNINEQFMAYGKGIKTFDATIFNRWGDEIFHFTDINKGWPGKTQSGSFCEQGTYVYCINVMDVQNKEYQYLGKVNLIR